ncbi:MAG: hypothetical protein HKP48_12110 [Winogradskyella sp.]|uniref:hypothetical protein n=1 Tax=Winogradskyella sp. TaxID=1883156 RepID=UPI0018242A79|nr:hypothetical protein [Winogradskyella sp.]MBT8244301.1 hypothetical protein [Winogradskyella sp.]NNK23998.1 hypothetical protein [Winogradskyella sp.]
MGKTNVLECDHCKRTYKLKELPNQIQEKFKLEKHSGVPIKYFAGLGITALIFAGIYYSNSKDKENEAIYIDKPLVGDVYRTTGSSANYYTTAKVTSVASDSIYMILKPKN